MADTSSTDHARSATPARSQARARARMRRSGRSAALSVALLGAALGVPAAVSADAPSTDDPATPPAMVAAAAETPTVIAGVSDFGYPNPYYNALGTMVSNWGPDYVVSTGDNWQVTNTPNPTGTDRYDLVVGQRFCEFLGGAASGPFCSGDESAGNRFFPVAGNHDHDDGPLDNYLSYFDLPGPGTTSESPSGSELYYDVVMGPVHLFVIDSESASVENEGGTPAVRTSVQKAWLQDALADSDAPWKVVALHEPPYGSSQDYGSITHLQWPYATWGADLVLNGHAAVYERIEQGGIPYITNGLSGQDPDEFRAAQVPGTQKRLNSQVMAGILLTATSNTLGFQLRDSNANVLDSYTFPAKVTVGVTTASPLASGQVGVPYSRTLGASGGTAPYTWSSSGTLPPGLVLSPAGVLSGTPTTAVTRTISVTATDANGVPSTAKSLTVTIAPAAPTGGTFRPLDPQRAWDSRVDGTRTCVKDLDLDITRAGGVPSGAAAVALNVTVTGAATDGFLTVHPTGTTRPPVSNLNFATRQTLPNAVTVKVGTGNQIHLYSSGTSCPHVIVDIAGYYTAGTPAPGGFTAIDPQRAWDSRVDGTRTCVKDLDLDITRAGGVPSGAAAVALNVTVTGAATDGFLTVHPTGTTRPPVSNLNFATRQTLPNAVTVKVGTGNQIHLYSSGTSCPHVIVDIAGYYKAS